jgi:hypothetical protein
MSRTGFPLLLAIGLLVYAGCDAGDPNLGTVTGKITLDGEPLADALVEFVPTGGAGSVSYGRTDANGEYEMEFARDTVGASIGENEIRITTGDVALDDAGKEVRVPEKVPARYNVNTELTREVTSGRNRIDLELTSEGEIADTIGDLDEG